MTTHPSLFKPYLTDEEVATHFGVSTDSIRRWIRQGEFPKPVRVGTGTSRWRALISKHTKPTFKQRTS